MCALRITNLPDLQKKDSKLGDALKQIQTYVTANVTPVAGNKLAPPSFITPGRKQG